MLTQEIGEPVWRETYGDGRRETDKEVMRVSGMELVKLEEPCCFIEELDKVKKERGNQ